MYIAVPDKKKNALRCRKYSGAPGSEFTDLQLKVESQMLRICIYSCKLAVKEQTSNIISSSARTNTKTNDERSNN